MLGESLHDPKAVESEKAKTLIAGMGLLPVRTVFGAEKTRTRAEGSCINIEGIFEDLSGMEVEGYEIHMGETSRALPPMAYLMESQSGSHLAKMDGCQRGNVYGTYLHGFFDRENIAETVVKALLKAKGLETSLEKLPAYEEYKEQQYEHLAEILRQSLDLKRIYELMGIKR